MNKCYICKREFNTNQGRFPVGSPTKHHIIPIEYRHRSKYKDEKELICKACHLQINKMFTNKKLLNMEKEEIFNNPKVISWVKWIRKKK